MAKGPIDRFKTYLGLNRKKIVRGKKKGNTTASPGSVYRDYRGTMGAVEDAQRTKKK